MYFFTADEHYGHEKIIEYCHRPFANVVEMDLALIANHNQVVGKNDITIHVGDFGWFNKQEGAIVVISQLNGSHIFLKGSHDRWLPDSAKFMWRKMIDGQFVVVSHYAMRTWERAHYGSWQLYGHSHGTLPGVGKQMDIGVDCNNFTPISFCQIKTLMDQQPILHGIKHDSPKDVVWPYGEW